jgi:cobyrinic acid a,c-diamide synthase
MIAPRLMIAGVSGGGGKTLVSVALAAAWHRQGHAVVPFKKGPDYIDAAWLSRGAGTPCRNLDLFLLPAETVTGSFASAAGRADIAVIEGNRGLFDGADADGTYSSAELAKLLRAPVVLVVDCTKATRTVAAVVLGCQRFDPEVRIAGVILNRTAGQRHEAVLRESITRACGVPVLGAIPRLEANPFPERHLGLVPPPEHAEMEQAVAAAAEVAAKFLDLEALWKVASGAPALDDASAREAATPPPRAAGTVPRSLFPVPQDDERSRVTVRVGVFRDAAFQFYYPENLEALVRAGARVIEISPLSDGALPEVDALYIGGGFPETLAAPLAANRTFMGSLRTAVDAGMPVYAECGGAVYLGERLRFDGREFPMVGALPAVFAFSPKPMGHGYAVLETVAENPFFGVGDEVKGHEFHYTYLKSLRGREATFTFTVRRGHGFDGRHDGLRCRNVLALYTHVHALGVHGWAPAVVRAARGNRRERPIPASFNR